MNVSLVGHYAYLADLTSGLQIADVTDPTKPTIVGSLQLAGSATGVTVSGLTAYVALGSSGVQIVDVSNPALPTSLGTVKTPDYAQDTAVSGGYAFIADAGSGMQVIAAQCPPPPIGTFQLLLPANGDSLHTDQPSLFWQAAHPIDPADTVSYHLIWGQDPTFTTADSIDTQTDTTYAFLPGILHVHTMYYWRVRAVDQAAGYSHLSKPPRGWSFYIVDANTPVLLAPTAVARDDGILVTCRILDGFDLTGLRVERRVPGGSWTEITSLLRPNGGQFQYLDTGAEPGVPYEYQVEVFGPQGLENVLGPLPAEMPAAVMSLSVRPNPAAGAPTVAFTLPRSGDVTLRVFDLEGREVSESLWPGMKPGSYQRSWEPLDRAGRRLPAGLYIIRLETPAGHKMVRWAVIR